ncbi:DEAD/DEAH box helicase [Stenotrophomonas sp. Sa5BUN4]|jgi:ATP-dependent RNA helicase DeaD|uniref:ATP-dependent RNA helicase DeaD n=1 Tax=Stenotrophomonas lacuserhaii TaxID=2760084 RepID=A0A8X8FW74_9GAMM|nr:MULTISPECIES: DEAD/DEAH box helicase [Stenotrophomonas]MBD7954027.1 DEAD/DEAH box helicase [Stenotrophomonas pennii]MDX3930355.1 DEAD/DEAH box helicase [Stenotrophomonas sp.]PKH70981.1 ATP-dependent RNA helicase [Stenotrophomonas sp. Betaine-02u-21]PKH71731.1 ATP-dependent RNA helicase [Stenotrophomonas sp. Betaine-02u-23]PKH95685.1 ATP-dependent RNA helicase [Stenotrophomonas sp. Bg11-02]
MSQDTQAPLQFAQLGLSEPVMQAVAAVGYETPSPIQAATIPAMLEGRDVLGQAQTGTGKTAAFALPVLSNIDLQQSKPQALVLAPTRELAIQVAEAFQTYSSKIAGFRVLPVYGGQPYATQLSALRRGVHIVVGTPGRVIDHLNRGTLDLSELKTLVLDEADEMLRMGFIDDVEAVLKKLPEKRQVALFSATMPPAIRRIAQTYLKDPAEVTIVNKTTTSANIRQRYWWVSGMHKLDALTRILEVEPFDAMIIFARTKAGTEELAGKLQARGLAAAAINGDMQQAQRERTIAMLKEGKLDILVATDVAARGLDVERISHVLNYDIPYDTESYVHRIGRTGRAGRSGEAILFATPREKGMLRQIERATRQPIEEMQLPSVEAVNDNRVNKFTARISETLGQGGLDFYRQLLERFEGENNVPAIDIAAALAKMMQGDTPFLLQPPVRAPREERAPRERFERTDRPERNDRFDRGERPKFDRAPRAEGEGFQERPRREMPPRGAPEQGMETFRIEVGHQHGVKPANIVGAIANEAGLESRFIGRIDIHDGFSVLDLPIDMPQDVLTHLKKVWVSGQQLNMRRVEPGEDISQAPRAPSKPRFDKGGPRRSGPGGPGAPGGSDRPPRREGFKPRGPRNV